jgi:hypothetical protein
VFPSLLPCGRSSRAKYSVRSVNSFAKSNQGGLRKFGGQPAFTSYERHRQAQQHPPLSLFIMHLNDG